MRPWWRTLGGWGTAAGWVVLVAGVALTGLTVSRCSSEIDRNAAAREEMEGEIEHMRAVLAWARDTSASATVPASAGRPVPTSDRAKRVWAINRMLVDRKVWAQEVMKRHGVTNAAPAGSGTARYYADAASYPAIGTYLQSRAAAWAELEKTAPAWLEARIVALARESGMPAGEVRDLFPHDFASPGEGEAGLAAALVEMHRHLVRMDPRVHHAGGNDLRYEREDDVRRVQEMETKVKAAVDSAARGRERKTAREIAALNRWIN